MSGRQNSQVLVIHKEEVWVGRVQPQARDLSLGTSGAGVVAQPEPSGDTSSSPGPKEG